MTGKYKIIFLPEALLREHRLSCTRFNDRVFDEFVKKHCFIRVSWVIQSSWVDITCTVTDGLPHDAEIVRWLSPINIKGIYCIVKAESFPVSTAKSWEDFPGLTIIFSKSVVQRGFQYP